MELADKANDAEMTRAEAEYQARHRPLLSNEEVEELLGGVELRPAADPRVLWAVEASLGLSVPTEFHARFREASFNVSGDEFPRWNVRLTEGLLRSLGEMVYGNNVASNLAKHYFLDLFKLNDGSHDLYVKYQSIIGSRRLGAVSDDLLDRLYEACESALQEREAEKQPGRMRPTPSSA